MASYCSTEPTQSRFYTLCVSERPSLSSLTLPMLFHISVAVGELVFQGILHGKTLLLLFPKL